MNALPPSDFLAELAARNDHNRRIVQTVLAPLEPTQRAWQPAPDEWGVDQCFQHLVKTFERQEVKTNQALAKAGPPPAGTPYRNSWMARHFFPWMFSPTSNVKTVKAFNPPEPAYPEAIGRFLDQKNRLAAMIERAAKANLRSRCWIYVGPLLFPYNLGDGLTFLIAHDELHIDQAQRVLAAHARWAEEAAAEPI